MRILIYRPGALGDLIVTLPLLQTLRRADPRGTIHVMAHPNHRTLLRFGHADADLSTDDPRIAFLYREGSAGDAGDGRFQKNMGTEMESSPGLPEPFHRQYDIVIGISRSADDTVLRTLKDITGARVAHCASFPDSAALPMREHLAHSARLAIEQPSLSLEVQPRLTLPGVPTARRERQWAFHAGAGSPTKQAPAGLFLAAMQRARTQQASLLLLEGPADHAATAAVYRAAIDAGVDPRIAVVHSAIEAATLLSGCPFFMGNDSGITHLAAACGARGIALFGPTDSHVWSPGGGIVTLAGENRTFPHLDALHNALDMLETPGMTEQRPR